MEAHKWQCRDCQRHVRQRFPGIQPCQRSSETYQKVVYRDHLDGTNRSRLGKRKSIGAATVDRYFRGRVERKFHQVHAASCPQILGIDEYFFTRRKGFATTLCDLNNHKNLRCSVRPLGGFAGILLPRSAWERTNESSLHGSGTHYRSLVRKHFPKAKIVADRFHVIRLVNQHCLNCWRELDPVASKSRGLLSLMRRHRHNLKPEKRCKLQAYLNGYPALDPIYRFKQRLVTYC